MLLITPLSSLASVMISSGQADGHCLEHGFTDDTKNIQQLVQNLCTMDECVDLCESLFHCSSHTNSITSAETGLKRSQTESPAFHDITTSHSNLLEFDLFRPPRI